MFVQHNHLYSRHWPAAGGGGSGSGGISSGGEGGDGFSGDDGASGWDARRIWTLVYAVSLIGWQWLTLQSMPPCHADACGAFSMCFAGPRLVMEQSQVMYLEAAVSTGGGVYAYKKKGSKASLYASCAVRQKDAGASTRWHCETIMLTTSVYFCVAWCCLSSSGADVQQMLS
jgi:hypothetical protein